MIVCALVLAAAGKWSSCALTPRCRSTSTTHCVVTTFTVQDSLFWVSFVVALTFAASVVPDDGYEHPLVVAGVVVYLRRFRGTRHHR